MKVTDKRTENKEVEWNVGDVVCYWDDDKDKNYSMISEHGGNYFFTDFSDSSDSAPGNSKYKSGSIKILMDSITNWFDHVEKVNAELVIKDDD